jgi:hypothetical protein
MLELYLVYIRLIIEYESQLQYIAVAGIMVVYNAPNLTISFPISLNIWTYGIWDNKEYVGTFDMQEHVFWK